MAVAQSVYSEIMVAGLPGQIANGEASNRISRTVEDAAGLAFGKAAFRGLTDHGCTGTPAAGAFLGFVAADPGVVATAAGAADQVRQYGTAAILTNIPCITTVQGLAAVVQGIEAVLAGDIGVRSLQDWAASRPNAQDHQA